MGNIVNTNVTTVITPRVAGDTIPNPDVRPAPVAASVGTGSSSNAPANAPAANKGNTQSVYTGLCEALNSWQRDLVNKGVYEYPDVYEVQFVPSAMGAATLKKQGSVDKKVTPNIQAKDAKSQLDPDTNKVDTAAVIVQVTSGTQIVQFLENYIRNSTYITDQQLYIVDPNSQKIVPSGASPTAQMAWYKISVSAVPNGNKKDEKRNDFPYKITYIITPYAINEMQSQWFPQSSFRGIHKSYKYWFTGENTQILGFEQNINATYSVALSGALPSIVSRPTDSRILTRKTWQTGSDASTQGPASGKVTEPGANAANFLYDIVDFTNIKLQIVGDPAWLQQGEVGPGISASNFTFSPFLSDGTINFNSQEVLFDISWNSPVDYNFSTGLMEVGENGTPPDVVGAGTKTQPKQNFTYRAMSCKSTFSRGRFSQELEGVIYTSKEAGFVNTGTSEIGSRPATGSTGSGAGTVGGTASGARTTNFPYDGSQGYGIQDESGQASNLRRNEYGDVYDPGNEPASDSGATPAPAAPTRPATSDGQIVSVTLPNTDDTTPSVNELQIMVAKDQ